MKQPQHPDVWRSAFLQQLRFVPVVQEACSVARISRGAAYRARKDDPEFAKAWDEAMEAGIDRAEQEAFRRAVIGYEEPVIHQGKLVHVQIKDSTSPGGVVLDENGKPAMVPLTVRKYSDRLLEVILKGRRKSTYSDRTELTSPDGSLSPVAPGDDATRAARVAQLLALAAARKSAGQKPAEEGGEFDDLA